MAANTSTSVTAHGAKTATLTFEIKNFAEVLAARGRGEGLTSDTVALGGGHFSCSVFPSGDSRAVEGMVSAHLHNDGRQGVLVDYRATAAWGGVVMVTMVATDKIIAGQAAEGWSNMVAAIGDSLTITFTITLKQELGSVAGAVKRQHEGAEKDSKVNESIAELKKTMEVVKEEITEAKEENAKVKKGVADGLKEDAEVRKEFGEVKEGVAAVMEELAEVKEEFAEAKKNVADEKEKVWNSNEEMKVQIREMKEAVMVKLESMDIKMKAGSAAAITLPGCVACQVALAPPAGIAQCKAAHKLCGACGKLDANPFKKQYCPLYGCGQRILGRDAAMEELVRQVAAASSQ